MTERDAEAQVRAPDGVYAVSAAAPASDALPIDNDTPLFVDLDGTLVTTDTLYESALAGLRAAPASLLQWPLWLAQGRARLKSELATRARIDVGRLPYDERLCALLRQERARGRRIYLATAADASIAQAVADHLGLFDGVIASDGVHNLKGRHKLEAIRRVAGERFAYVGNGSEDLPIWVASAAAVVVNAGERLEREARSVAAVAAVLPRRTRPVRAAVRALRPHQWVKNVLIFVPVLTSFRFSDPAALLAAVLAFVAFCLCASATYIVNDLLDLNADRAHPRKRSRPFAAGQLPIPAGAALALALVAAGLALAAVHSPLLLATVAGYMVVTSAYSLRLKHYVLLDAIVLASLYTWRLFAGVVAARVDASVWLLGFALFVFLSLALLKRCAELVMIEAAQGPGAAGRDYRVADLRVLWPLGIALGACSVVVFVLYATAPEVRVRYASPGALWAVAVGLIYWLSRMWLKTARGEMSDDPIVYALRDRGSRVLIAAMIAAVLFAHFVPITALSEAP
jgi:4-hydroxybenzoate polyprenyltransferase/phosphoserine phosphatase